MRGVSARMRCAAQCYARQYCSVILRSVCRAQCAVPEDARCKCDEMRSRHGRHIYIYERRILSHFFDTYAINIVVLRAAAMQRSYRCEANGCRRERR